MFSLSSLLCFYPPVWFWMLDSLSALHQASGSALYHTVPTYPRFHVIGQNWFHTEILSRVSVYSTVVVILRCLLYSVVHVIWVLDNPLPKTIFFREIYTGCTSHTHPSLPFRSHFKMSLILCGVLPNCVEVLTANPETCISLLDAGAKHFQPPLVVVHGHFSVPFLYRSCQQCLLPWERRTEMNVLG